ncbi:5955_t:CDS:2 [Entrophospora sp. SA101]|nr:5953_t:CDS:2 [Entrophospora sp. SA101]CAJ0837137.1 5955_t:CDS:2 [Entrophospora sp. SA101]
MGLKIYSQVDLEDLVRKTEACTRTQGMNLIVPLNLTPKL